MDVIEAAHQQQERMVALRRAMHRDPEVGLHLPRTQRRVLDELADLPLELTVGDGCSSVTAVLRGSGGADAPVVLLRADMDALSVAEETGLPFASEVPGAAEEYAVTQPGGRLRVPMAGILDEAANVCRWASLPDVYSHFGSRGINLVTILQSWSQCVDVWSQSGMRKLWSASNVKIYAGGVDEVDFLKQLSDNVGDFRYEQRTVSRGRDGATNVSRSLSKERTLDVSDLAALPRGRAIVFGSGSVPTMMRTVPWMDGRHAEKVRESIARAEARS